MALMPEDLENKRFTPVRFSEGYDMDEVDNYLDLEVLPRLQELIDENARLTSQLDEANNRVAQLESGEGAAAAATAEPGTEASEAEASAEAEAPAEAETTEAPAAEASAAEEPETAAAAVTESGTEAAAPATAQSPEDQAGGIIALANRLHDEYVRNGEDERDRLVSEANEEHRRIVGEAEEKARTTLEDLEGKKADLEKSLESLRTFERDYRNRLRNYLENQLRELDTSDTQDKQANFGL
jgi:DivIVA domain-containing protein